MKGLIAVAALVIATTAHAGDPRCNAPPYSSTVGDYKAYIARWATVDPVSTVPLLEGTCRAKFHDGSRKPLYAVGLTDDDISNGDVTEMADAWARTVTQWATGRQLPPLLTLQHQLQNDPHMLERLAQQSRRPADVVPAEIQPGPKFEQRVRDCVQSPEMADQADAYRKCLAKELHQDPATP